MMEIGQKLTGFLSRYGVEVALGEDRFKAVLFPAFKTTMGRRETGDYLPAGKNPRNEIIYIGSPEHPIREDDLMISGGQEYVVRACMTVYFKNVPLYIRAILAQGGRGDVPWQ